MTGLWAKPGVPQTGWRCVDVYDVRGDGATANEAEYATCEMCERERIRFVHILEHDTFRDQLRVGRICAQNLSEDYINPRIKEAALKSKAKRKENWLARRWQVSTSGNDYIKIDKRILVVFPDKNRSGMWKYKIDSQFSKKSYPSSNSAKMALFEEFWEITHTD